MPIDIRRTTESPLVENIAQKKRASDPLSGYRDTSKRSIFEAALLSVFLLATIHNYLGVIAALTLGATLTNLRKGRLFWGGLAPALYIAATFAAARMLIPSAQTMSGQAQEVVRFIAFAIFSTVIWRTSTGSMVRVLKLFFLIMLILLPIYLVTGAFGVIDASGARRFAGLMPYANHLGYIAASTALTLAYLVQTGVAPKNVGFMLVALICLIIATQSSGALLVLTLGLAALALKLRMSPRRLVGSLVGAAAIGVMLSSPIGQLALEKLAVIDLDTVLAKSENYKFGDQGSSLAWRFSYWTAMFNAQIESGRIAVLFGQGGGAATLGDELYFFMNKDPHSDFVKLFIEYGVIGGALLLAMLARSVWLSGAGILGLVIFFGPMLTGNSFTSSAVIFVLICNVKILHETRRFN